MSPSVSADVFMKLIRIRTGIYFGILKIMTHLVCTEGDRLACAWAERFEIPPPVPLSSHERALLHWRHRLAAILRFACPLKSSASGFSRSVPCTAPEETHERAHVLSCAIVHDEISCNIFVPDARVTLTRLIGVN